MLNSYNKTKYRVNDSVFVDLTLFNGLSNKVLPLNFSKVAFDNAELKIIGDGFTNIGYKRINDRNYQSFSLPKICLIFHKAGKYDLGKLTLNGTIDLYKQKKGSMTEDYFGLNDQSKDVSIQILKKEVQIIK